ncbi:DUF3299 domain-containing protein [Piscinibacter sp. HJYY11]|uniref:DUF3299 domain-containing protein n=1 Tax=Piscinibacter sp. HJYY11 TaxID=2801333 RepID=UPI00191D1E78|nr:DUF3299 domain-containing protein [Piscinibacter sp. HJYY11]MBL0726437.1 DUF3299 domain-containing protein [Piscinibacter sp. HJYY11]
MRPVHQGGSLETQFPHLRGDAHAGADAGARTGWKIPALAVLATVVTIVLAAIVVPSARKTLDFRQQPAPEPYAGDPAFEQMRWSDLVPSGWDPAERIRTLQQRHTGIGDSDPRARALLAQMREVLDQAPADASLAGRRIRIPGYVVPLGGASRSTTEFLLVPYFGACIHTPPPPANQVIHVVTTEPVKGLAAMDAVWVRGTVEVTRVETATAISGYRLRGATVEAYDTSRKR